MSQVSALSDFFVQLQQTSLADVTTAARELTFGGTGRVLPYPHRGTPNQYETSPSMSWDENGLLSVDQWWYRSTSRWMGTHYEIPLLLALGYYVFVVVLLQRWMKTRQPPAWINPLVSVWNLLLAVFSAVGMYFEAVYMYESVMQIGLAADLCTTPRKSLTPWGFLFCMSKMPELIDTVILVLKKKPVIFLHWYHHIVTMLFCWDAWVLQVPQGGIFALMNLFVHTFMYGYFFVMTKPLGKEIRVPGFVPLTITIMQISQMFAGLFVLYFNFTHCHTTYISSDFRVMLNLVSGIGMYLSFLILFVNFFFGRYLFGSNKPPTTTTKSVKSE